MPKRKDMEYYLHKIKKIERKIKRRYNSPSSVSSSPSSPIPDQKYDEPQEVDIELADDSVIPSSEPIDTNPTVTALIETSLEPEPTPEPVAESAISPEVLEALGDLMPEKPKYGPALNNDLARIWNNILKNGLQKEFKEKLEKNAPENCTLLKAPLLNPEITASVSDIIINRDKKIESEQNQLGLGLTILEDTLSMLIDNNNIDRLKVISLLSNAGRVLTDLHFMQTKIRKNLIFPVLDKKFTDIVKDIDRDEYLYGNNLTEKIKVLKTCQRTGQSIKKPVAPSTLTRQGNVHGPPRYNQQRTTPRPGQKKQFPYQHKGKQFPQPQPVTARRHKAPPQEKARARR